MTKKANFIFMLFTSFSIFALASVVVFSIVGTSHLALLVVIGIGGAFVTAVGLIVELLGELSKEKDWEDYGNRSD